ncbi:hypothetical protein [Mycobacteroides abscessus]
MIEPRTNTKDTWLVGPQIHEGDIPDPIQYVSLQTLTVTTTLQCRFAIRWHLSVSLDLAVAEADLWRSGHWNEVWSEHDIPVISAMDPDVEAKAASWDAALDVLTPYVTTVLGLRSLT